jgi:hypothetical protein
MVGDNNHEIVSFPLQQSSGVVARDAHIQRVPYVDAQRSVLVFTGKQRERPIMADAPYFGVARSLNN